MHSAFEHFIQFAKIRDPSDLIVFLGNNKHFLLDCPLFNNERVVLLNNLARIAFKPTVSTSYMETKVSQLNAILKPLGTSKIISVQQSDLISINHLSLFISQYHVFPFSMNKQMQALATGSGYSPRDSR